MDEGRLRADFDQVLGAEIDLLSELRLDGDKAAQSAQYPSPYARAHAAKLTGLAFSGGGIRSATFNLGVIMGLAKSGVLSRFDYLSTVSGGGYVGAWLSALLQRHAAQGRAQVGCVETVDARAVAEFEPSLTTHPTDSGLPPPDTTCGFKPVEHAAVRYLRRYCRYLAPRAGLSGDLLAAVSLFLRNFLLLQLGLVAALAAVLMSAHLIGLWSASIQYRPPWLLSWLVYLGAPFGWTWPFMGAALGLFVALVAIGRFLSPGPGGFSRGKGAVIAWVILPGTLAAWWLGMGMFTWPQDLGLSDRGLTQTVARWVGGVWPAAAGSDGLEAALWVGVGTLAYALTWFIGYLSRQAFRRFGGSERGDRPPAQGLFSHLWPALFAGGIFGLMIYLTIRYVAGHDEQIGPWLGVAFGTPFLILLFSVVVAIHIGVARDRFSEQDREWFARVGGWTLMTALIWTLVFALVLFAPPVMRWLASGGLAAIAAWATGSGAGAWLARSAETTGPGKGGWKQVAAGIAPWLFVIGLSVLVAYCVHLALLGMFEPERGLEGRSWRLESPGDAGAVTTLLLQDGELEATTGCGRLTGIYLSDKRRGLSIELDPVPETPCPPGTERERLAAADALNQARRYRVDGDRLVLLGDGAEALLRSPAPESFGALVAAEHARLSSLKTSLPGVFWTWVGTVVFLLLFLLRFDINLFSLHTLYRNRLDRAYLGASRAAHRTTCNPVTGFDPGDDLPFHDLCMQRPIHIVNTTINMTGGDDLAWQTRRGASFAFTPCWAGFQAKTSQGHLIGCYRPTAEYAGGLSLATLTAVSGAAASPNMGYHSTPAVAALLTAFNLRLGRWCGNPEREATWRRPSPAFAARPILAELTGSATGKASWIDLSDGGHFENLGLYELVRRRCRLILVSDAGCDPEHTFSDLANAIRRCWTDFGVHIDVPDLNGMRRVQGGRHSKARHTIGRIHYPDHSDDGLLIYLKASLNGKEPVDIREYADAHARFPHESTGDQFFDEDQFEAYRHLGFDIAAEVAGTLETVWRNNGWPPDYGAWPSGA